MSKTSGLSHSAKTLTNYLETVDFKLVCRKEPAERIGQNDVAGGLFHKNEDNRP